ncbi:oligosaccharide flippase family protein [Escherichia albertii]|uniref:Putative O-antigen transporter n=1 Tax=Escherichia albertii TaxID=208962 RepID=A0A5A4U7L9_ESCAL|nr:oligosaccharide flippase family protein [Escherichia albertii]MCZ8630990.1 oligosaccharide flippase family protein [Escherichia albertii]MCZ8635830.1 oligosaccharide flippase family protein [Escherichia albertii]BBM62610.1 O-antigen flippase [Escherichia albertii]
MKIMIKLLNVQNRNVVIYLISDLIAKTLPFLFIPVVTKYLTPEQYGNIALFNIGVEIFLIIIIMGGNSYYKIEYPNFEKPIQALYVIIYNVTLLFLILFFLSLIAWSFYKTFYFIDIFPLVLLCAYFQSLFYLYLSYYQCNENALVVGVVNLFFSLSSSLLMILLLVGFKQAESSRYWSLLGGLFASVLVLIGILAKKNNEKYKAINKINWDLIKFGLGVFPHAVSWWARSGMERLLISWFLSVSTLGIYSLAMQLTSVMPLFCNAINQALIPRIVKCLNDQKIDETKKILFKSTLVIVLACVLSSIIVPLCLKYILNNRYHEALVYLPYMILSFIFQGIIIIYTNVLYFYKYVKYLSVVTFGTSCVHLLFSFVLIKINFNVYSVIISSAITFLFASIVLVRKAHLLINRRC